jgi:hypothetical protein
MNMESMLIVTGWGLALVFCVLFLAMRFQRDNAIAAAHRGCDLAKTATDDHADFVCYVETELMPRLRS